MTLYLNALTLVLALTCSFKALSAEKLNKNELTEHQQWLQKRFSEQHNQLIPIVAVADMLFACNKANDQAYGKDSLNSLITKTSKTRLAEKLSSCLGGKSVTSDIAINYGLLGCFHDQLKDLPLEEKTNKMALVKKTIFSLSLEERKQSFTQCVTEQSIAYLK
jgi:hypothetical protein